MSNEPQGRIEALNGVSFPFSKNLYETLRVWINALVKRNQDVVMLFDGKEGAGKSVFMRQVAAVCQLILYNEHKIHVPLSIDNIHFELENYIDTAISHESKKGYIHILDESRAIANRKRSMSGSSVKFTNYLSECRSSNHIHLIALPAFHDLDPYVVVWRSVFVIHMEKYFDNSGELQLGNYKLYMNNSVLKNVYYHKMKYLYPRKHKFSGKSENIEILDNINEYESKKAEARAKKFLASEEETNFTDKQKSVVKRCVLELFYKHQCKQAYIAKTLGISKPYVTQILGEIKES